MSKRVKGVLDNFLGTFTSRYSDHNGYWVFGMLVGDLGELRIDLLRSIEGKFDNTPLGTVTKLAAEKFREQMEKTGLAVTYAQEASIKIKKLTDPTNGFVNGRRCPGWTFQFTARVVSHSGYACEREKSVFVAPHNPKVEQRSARPPGSQNTNFDGSQNASNLPPET